MSDEKSPLDQALDLFVFAPLGLAITARDQLPELVEKGRSQVENQVTMARFVGQFAVQQGKVELERRLRPRPTEDAAPAPAPAPATESSAPAPTSVTDPSSSPGVNGGSPPATELAIPGYDALSASQVVQRLAGLGDDELEQVRRYEMATRGRKTVLSKIAQLQG